MFLLFLLLCIVALKFRLAKNSLNYQSHAETYFYSGRNHGWLNRTFCSLIIKAPRLHSPRPRQLEQFVYEIPWEQILISEISPLKNSELHSCSFEPEIARAFQELKRLMTYFCLGSPFRLLIYDLIVDILANSLLNFVLLLNVKH